MGEGDDQEGSRSGAFSSFWQKSLGKVGKGSNKSAKFVSSVTKPGDTENDGPGTGTGTEADNLTPKQRRRAQVRKAQIEHRQRKENYVKHLEQDVIDLREMIATATTQAVLFKHENEAIRATLSKSPSFVPAPSTSAVAQTPLSSPPAPSAPSQPPAQAPNSSYEPLEFSSFNQDYSLPLAPPANNLEWPTEAITVSNYSPSNSSSLVSTCFDEFIDTSCLQIMPILGVKQDVSMTGIDLPNTNPPAQDFNAGKHKEKEKELPPLPHDGKLAQPEIDLETIAVNFILALEHPCRTHFHAPSTNFDPTGSPSGHELMASTLLYSSAPPHMFDSPSFQEPFPASTENTTSLPTFGTPVPGLAPTAPTTPKSDLSWKTEPLGLDKLYEISTSLPKSDWEITPIQAWFKLVERYPAHVFLSYVPDSTHSPRRQTLLDKLKQSLCGVVDCFAFGAVMDEARFWEIVEREMEGFVQH